MSGRESHDPTSSARTCLSVDKQNPEPVDRRARGRALARPCVDWTKQGHRGEGTSSVDPAQEVPRGGIRKF